MMLLLLRILQWASYFSYPFQYYRHGKAEELELKSNDIPDKINSVTAKKQHVWLVQNYGWKRDDPDGQVKAWLDRNRTLKDHQTFQGVKTAIDIYFYEGK